MFNNSFGAFEDVVIWVLPIPVIAKLHLPASKKCKSFPNAPPARADDVGRI